MHSLAQAKEMKEMKNLLEKLLNEKAEEKLEIVENDYEPEQEKF